MMPSPDAAVAELTPMQRDEPTAIVDGRWPRFVAGGADDVGATLEQMSEETGADELTIQDLIADPAARRHSHELLSDMFDLPAQRGISAASERGPQ